MEDFDNEIFKLIQVIGACIGIGVFGGAVGLMAWFVWECLK